MIAALPMYDLGRAQAGNDAFWALVRQELAGRGIAAPAALARGLADLWPLWTDPGLVLSQTCGMPFRTRLYGQVALVATPDYGVPDTPAGHYRSYLVARADDPRRDLGAFDGARLAYNDAGSQSGWAAPVTHASALGLAFRAGPRTGAHLASLRAVAAGQADLCAVDAVTWMIAGDSGLLPDGLRVIGATDPTPGLPYITAAGRDPVPVRDALTAAAAALPPDARAAIRLQGIVALPAAAYLAVPTPPPPEAFS